MSRMKGPAAILGVTVLMVVVVACGSDELDTELLRVPEGDGLTAEGFVTEA